MRTRPHAYLHMHSREWFYGPYSRPGTGLIRSVLLAVFLGIGGAVLLAAFLSN